MTPRQCVQRLQIEGNVVGIMKVAETSLTQQLGKLIAATLGDLDTEAPAVIGFEQPNAGELRADEEVHVATDFTDL